MKSLAAAAKQQAAPNAEILVGVRRREIDDLRNTFSQLPLLLSKLTYSGVSSKQELQKQSEVDWQISTHNSYHRPL